MVHPVRQVSLSAGVHPFHGGKGLAVVGHGAHVFDVVDHVLAQLIGAAGGHDGLAGFLPRLIGQALGATGHGVDVDAAAFVVDVRQQVVVGRDVVLAVLGVGGRFHDLAVVVDVAVFGVLRATLLRLVGLGGKHPGDDAHVHRNAVADRVDGVPVQRHRRLEVVELAGRFARQVAVDAAGHDQRQQGQGDHKAADPTQAVKEPGTATGARQERRAGVVEPGEEGHQRVELRNAKAHVHHLAVVVDHLTVLASHAPRPRVGVPDFQVRAPGKLRRRVDGKVTTERGVGEFRIGTAESSALRRDQIRRVGRNHETGLNPFAVFKWGCHGGVLLLR